MNKTVIINEKDNVGIMLEGDGKIPDGHKFALRDIAKGEYIIKYGQIIGIAKEDIQKGDWVHTHNVKTHLNEKTEYTYTPTLNEPKKETYTFKGFKNDFGEAGIRNEIYILPTVGCVNGVCSRIEKMCQKFVTGTLDGIFSLPHQFGCSQLGDDQENIKNFIIGIAENPNAAYVLLVGLGCENNALAPIKEQLEKDGRTNVRYMICQDEKDELQKGIEIVEELATLASQRQREDLPLSKLTIGLKCGGSDGYSGLTANPLLGKLTDHIVSLGAGAILTEVPEMFGAEMMLMNKCRTEEIFTEYKKMVEDFKDSYTKLGFPIYENPSPGNKKGGITTLEEKSLGCVEKAGTTPINDVLDYCDRVEKRGVSVLSAPGNDLIASTALAASGCQIVLFTTGRGTPFSTFVPTMKVSSNSRIADKKDNWIDFNAYTGTEEELFNLLIKTIEGNYKCKSEDIREIAFYKKGVTL